MHEAAQRSLQVISAGFNGEFNLPPELCTVIARGEGYEAEDTSGNAFLDFSMVWGSVLVGHARPEVAEAVVRQAALGATFAWVNENSLALSATRGASRASAIPSATTGWRSPASTVQTAAPSQHTAGGNGRDLTSGEQLDRASDACLRDCAATLKTLP